VAQRSAVGSAAAARPVPISQAPRTGEGRRSRATAAPLNAPISAVWPSLASRRCAKPAKAAWNRSAAPPALTPASPARRQVAAAARSGSSPAAVQQARHAAATARRPPSPSWQGLYGPVQARASTLPALSCKAAAVLLPSPSTARM
jgi:hypothetical protein